MNYLVENMTRAPSQVLVRSASTFGEEAAKVLGKIIEESMKNCTNDITACIKECTTIASKKLGKTVSNFGQTFKETGIEGFTEWGIGIERAFYHLGHKLETGLYNATGRAINGIQETIDDSMSKLDGTVRDSTQHVTENLLMKQIPAWKNTFQKELNILLGCIILLCAAIFIWACSSFVSLMVATPAAVPQMYYPASGDMTTLVTPTGNNVKLPSSRSYVPPFIYLINILLCAVFASLIGYALYIWDYKHKADDGSITKEPAHPVSDINDGNTTTTAQQDTRQKKERTLSPSTNDISRILDSPKGFLFIVGALGFFAGNIGHQIASSFNSFLLMIVLGVVVMIVYRAMAFKIIYQVYKLYKRFQQFRQWEREQDQLNQQVSSSTRQGANVETSATTCTTSTMTTTASE